MAHIDIRHVRTSPGNPASYSSAVRYGDLILTSGHLGAAPGDAPIPFGAQARVALERLLATVDAAGGRLETILKVNAYLASMDDFEEYDSMYRSIIAVDPMPARTSVEIGGFIAPTLIEVDAVAVSHSRE